VLSGLLVSRRLKNHATEPPFILCSFELPKTMDSPMLERQYQGHYGR